jgi:hypothetical protein
MRLVFVFTATPNGELPAPIGMVEMTVGLVAAETSLTEPTVEVKTPKNATLKMIRIRNVNRIVLKCFSLLLIQE